MPDQKINILITATDATRSAFNSASSGFSGLREKINSHSLAITAATTAAVGALGYVAKKSIEEFQKQEEVSTKLRTLILNQKDATMENVTALEAQAAAMQEVTTFGDDVVMSAQAQLATFDLTSEAIQQIIPGFLDMVAAEKGAVVSSEEMKIAAQGMGKALVGQTDALIKQGFIFTDLQKEILKTGTEQERLNVITEVMGKTYGGVAAEMKNTFVGQMEAVKNQLGEVGELIGAELVPIMRDQLLPFMSDTLIPFIENTVVPSLRSMSTGIDVVADSWNAMTDTMANWMIKWDSAKGKVQEFKEAHPFIGGKWIDDITSSITGRASGGPVSSGTPYMVGERGPELFVPNRSGNIVPNNTINLGGITINNEADSSDFFRKLNSMLGGGVESNLMGVS